MFFSGETPLDEGPRHPGQSSGLAMAQMTAAKISGRARRQNLMGSVTGAVHRGWWVVRYLCVLMTPAMAAGITDHIWSVRGLLEAA